MGLGSRIVITNIRALVVIALCVLPTIASAQYFGENKVQYRRHRFHVLETDHFDIYFHQPQREAVERVGRLAERWHHRLSRFFGQDLTGRQPIVLYSSKADFEQTSVVSGLIDGGTAGLTEPWRRRIALPFAGPLADTDHVLGHEIVHAFQFDLIGRSASSGASSSATELPLWAIEGLAEYLTLGAEGSHTAMWLRDGVREKHLPTVTQLDRPRYNPYRWGHAFWAYVGGTWGDATVLHLFTVATLVGMHEAIESVLGITVEDFTRDWHGAIHAAYPPGRPPSVGTHVRGAQAVGGSINVGAAISPDGRWIACLADRLFAIDLVVIDAATGRDVARLTDMAVERRYSSLPFVGSSPAWNKTGSRLAVGTMKSGRAAISVFRWPGGQLEKDIVIGEVDEILGLTWSPDGKRIAFSAMSGGVIDLFVHDLDPATLQRLTDDAYAELQPAWAPDGHTLAFVTDRFTTDLDKLTSGPYRLATIDILSRVVGPVPAFPSGKHLAPQWSSDGGSVYFISDSDGAANLYAVDLASGALTRLTDSEVGVSGLTPSSPALSVAAGAGIAAVTVYESGSFAIHTLALGSVVPVTSLASSAPRLPPSNGAPPTGERSPDSKAEEGNPESWRISQYRARLGVEGISQVALGVGVDAYGVGGGGGLVLTFSDLLNQHWLVTAVQTNNSIDGGFSVKDLATFGGYFNRVRRWHWGVAGSMTPTYVSRLDGRLNTPSSLFRPMSFLRQTERAARAMASYPFNRARRIEFRGGVSWLAFDQLSGFDIPNWTAAAPPVTLSSGAVAFVSDTSHSGPLSVVRGERYRLEIAPVLGTIEYVSLVADYRRYAMPFSFYTIAARVMHLGRYGSGAEDPRIAPLYVGYPWLVRGYDRPWTVVNECVSVLSADCPELSGLLGSRLAVANLEFRFPLLRPLGLSSTMYGPLPVEVALFVDGGTAWRASRFPSHDDAVMSTGMTLRTSLLGFGLGQFDIAYPFRQAASGWVMQFNLSPAF